MTEGWRPPPLIAMGLATPSPCPELVRFLEETPDFGWRQSLHFMLDHVPQIKDGDPQPVWLLESGAAIHLRYPQRQVPKDIDIVTRSGEVAYEYTVDGFDIRHIREWFRPRGLRYSPESAEALLAHYEAVDFDGRKVLTLDPVGLAVSKRLHFAWGELREKDLADIALIQADPQAVDALCAEVGKYRRQ